MIDVVSAYINSDADCNVILINRLLSYVEKSLRTKHLLIFLVTQNQLVGVVRHRIFSLSLKIVSEILCWFLFESNEGNTLTIGHPKLNVETYVDISVKLVLQNALFYSFKSFRFSLWSLFWEKWHFDLSGFYVESAFWKKCLLLQAVA